MWVGGAGVTRGYINLPELTSRRYKLDKFMENGCVSYMFICAMFYLHNTVQRCSIPVISHGGEKMGPSICLVVKMIKLRSR
jgi:hypothetical protein